MDTPSDPKWAVMSLSVYEYRQLFANLPTYSTIYCELFS